jgi:hypothetical protein
MAKFRSHKRRIKKKKKEEEKIKKGLTTANIKAPLNRHESPESVRFIALYYFDLGAWWGWVVSTTPGPLYPQKRSGTHCTGGWVGPRAGLGVCEKSRPYRVSIPRPSRP